MNRTCSIVITLLLFLLIVPLMAHGADRFPRPEFETEYQLPDIQNPVSRHALFDIIDVVLLLSTLAIATWIIHHYRSRLAIFILMSLSLFYFGFIRAGCVCPVGSLQNVVYSFFSSGYSVPIYIIIFFVAPILVALFFGRTFCGAVCPLGAIQDLVLVKAISVPKAVRIPLSILPVIYLGLALSMAATGSGFIICRFDPFVSLFRLNGSAPKIVYGMVMLGIGMFIGRPYCRFLCPYGLILRIASQISMIKMTTTPDDCINCRLCEPSCPYDALKKPTEKQTPREKKYSIRMISIFLLLTPLFMAGLGWAGYHSAALLSLLHPRAHLLWLLERESINGVSNRSLETRTFNETGTSRAELASQVYTIYKGMQLTGIVTGIIIGLGLGVIIISTFRHKNRSGYEPDPAECFNCGRCIEYCPREHLCRGSIKRAPPGFWI